MFAYENIGHILLYLIILFIVALLVVRLMGNRTVGQLSPFDFVIMVGIGDIIVTASMDRNQTLFGGIEALIGLLVLQQILSYSALKSKRLRKWFEGTPVTLIENGEILKENFIKTQFNFDDLRQELHKQGLAITDLKDIKIARLESSGDVSIIKMPETTPLTKMDFENYFNSIYENPLSPAGAQWAKMEQLMKDVRYLTEYIRRQDGESRSASKFLNETEHSGDVH